MAHTYTVLLYHVVFSTRRREPLLTPEIRGRLFPYMSGIIAQLGGKALIINGVADHVHILLRLKAKTDVAEAVQAIKGGSSTWFNKESGVNRLHWQEGYGAFTVSYSRQSSVFRYIEEQEAHHRKKSFAEEYTDFLLKHGIEFDPRFVFD